MWSMNLSGEILETESYPERPGEPDCSYYIRTGSCRFGTTCRFNHPPNRKLVIAAARLKGEFPERLGQPECQYYLKTGTCKFGATCKFHHPKDKAGITGRVSLNIYGYPLRPGELECAYYLRTGQCKFGSTCKFDHPQPSNMVVSLRDSPIYPTFSSPTTPTQQSFPGVTNWSLSRTSFMTSPRWQSPSSYAPVIVPQGMITMSNWNSYTSQSQTPGSGQVFGETHQSDLSNSSSQGGYPPFGSGSLPLGFYSLGRENVFPERPGQPECQFYMKTGDCKFGIVCRFHHPRERLVPAPDCLLSQIGLPLRPGEPLCVFYSRYGICKFGLSCKFNHPMGIFSYNTDLSSSSATEMRCLLECSFSGGNAPSITPATPMQMVDGDGKGRRIPLSEPTGPMSISMSSPVDDGLSRDSSTWHAHTESE